MEFGLPLSLFFFLIRLDALRTAANRRLSGHRLVYSDSCSSGFLTLDKILWTNSKYTLPVVCDSSTLLGILRYLVSSPPLSIPLEPQVVVIFSLSTCDAHQCWNPSPLAQENAANRISCVDRATRFSFFFSSLSAAFFLRLLLN